MQVKVVVGIRNEAAEKYNISAVMGSLNNAQDFRAYYWNFTQQVCGGHDWARSLRRQMGLRLEQWRGERTGCYCHGFVLRLAVCPPPPSQGLAACIPSGLCIHRAITSSTFCCLCPQQVYFQVVEPSKELSVEYTFLPPKDLPPNDYQVALTVFYEAADGFKSSTFFNQTVSVSEKPQLIDWKLIFLYVIFIGLVAAGGRLLGLDSSTGGSTGSHKHSCGKQETRDGGRRHVRRKGPKSPILRGRQRRLTT